MKSLRSRAHQALVRELKEARARAGLTQAQLSKHLKRPQSFVSKYEGGERRIDVPEFLEIAGALKADPAAIIKRLA